MILNESGKIVYDEWGETSEIRKNVLLDEFVVMPNHVHGVVVVMGDGGKTEKCDEKNVRRGVLQYAPTITDIPTTMPGVFRSPSNNLGAIVRGFKSATTKQINEWRQIFDWPVWQRNYYEHIVRDKKSLEKIRWYIKMNPALWSRDRNNMEIC